MALEKQKEALQSWRGKRDRTLAAVDAFGNTLSSHLLIDDANRSLQPQVGAVTRDRLQPLYLEFNNVYTQRAVATNCLLAAQTLYNDFIEWEQLPLGKRLLSPKSADAVAAEIDKLLTEPSLAFKPLETKPTGQVLGAIDSFGKQKPGQLLTLEQFWSKIDETWDKLRHVINEIESIFSTWKDRVQAATDALDPVQKLAGELGEELPLLTDAKSKLDQWQRQIFRDPLAAQTDASSSIVASIEAAKRSLDELKVKKGRLDGDLLQAPQRLPAADTLHQQVVDAYEAVTAKISNAEGVIAPDDNTALDDFRERLQGMTDLVSSGQWKVAVRALEAWNRQLDEYQAELTRRAAANQAPIDKRDDLRGELAAWQAKASSLKLSENDQLEELARQANQVLFTAPCDLTVAAQLVARYATTLHRLSGGKSAA